MYSWESNSHCVAVFYNCICYKIKVVCSVEIFVLLASPNNADFKKENRTDYRLADNPATAIDSNAQVFLGEAEICGDFVGVFMTTFYQC